jgi:predicted RNA-binding protein with PUA-like domain
MAQYWILKSEPTSYSYEQLERDRKTASGDEVLIYHTGKEKALVGKAKIVSEPYPDPAAGDPKLAVVDIQAVKPLEQSVPLAAVKAEKSLADLALVRMGRLSVVPATPAQWKRLLRMAGE